jgi:hypothetical protein
VSVFNELLREGTSKPSRMMAIELKRKAKKKKKKKHKFSISMNFVFLYSLFTRENHTQKIVRTAFNYHRDFFFALFGRRHTQKETKIIFQLKFNLGRLSWKIGSISGD